VQKVVKLVSLFRDLDFNILCSAVLNEKHTRMSKKRYNYKAKIIYIDLLA